MLILGKIRFVPPQLREIGCHVQNHATQWHGFQHEIQLQEIVVAWIKMTHYFECLCFSTDNLKYHLCRLTQQRAPLVTVHLLSVFTAKPAQGYP